MKTIPLECFIDIQPCIATLTPCLRNALPYQAMARAIESIVPTREHANLRPYAGPLGICGDW